MDNLERITEVGKNIKILLSFALLVTLMFVLTKENTTPEESVVIEYTDTLHLASIINAECGICNESEKRKVGSVVLNRVDSESFPDDIFCVITDDNQFNGYYTGNYNPCSSCLRIAKELMKGIGRADSILYFWNPKMTTDTNFLNQMQGRILYKEKYHFYAY